MANELVLIAKANGTGLRRVLFREQLTPENDRVRSEKEYSHDPDGLMEYLWDTIYNRSTFVGDINDGWAESLYDGLAALINNFEAGTRNQIRVELQDHVDPEDENVIGRLYVKFYGNGVNFSESYTQIMRPADPPPAAAFPEGWIDGIFGEFAVRVGETLSVPEFDLNTATGQMLTLNVRVFHGSTEIVAWVNAGSLSYVVPEELEGEEIRLNFWLNSNVSPITNAYEDKFFTVYPAIG